MLAVLMMHRSRERRRNVGVRTIRDKLYVEWTDGHGDRRLRRWTGTKAKAESFVRSQRAEAAVVRRSRRLGVEPPREEVNLQELGTAWLAHVTVHCRPSTVVGYKLGIKEVLGFLEAELQRRRGRRVDLEVRHLRLVDLDRYASWKKREAKKQGREVAASTINQRIGAVRTMLNWAVQQGRLSQHPLARWQPLRGPKLRQRTALKRFEVAKLLQESPPELADVWRFFLGTGLRNGELTALEWLDVDWDAPAIHVRGETSKSGRDHTIPLNDDLVAVLRRQRQRRPPLLAKARDPHLADRLVFLTSRGGPWRGMLSRRLKPCLRAAGLAESVDVHTLRHTFGSLLIGDNVDLKTVQLLLCHAKLSTTVDTYCHELEGERRRDAVDLLRFPSVTPANESACTARATGTDGKG